MDKTLATIGIAGSLLLGGVVVYDEQGQPIPDTTVFQTVQEIDIAQQAYFAEHGKYLQVMKDSKLTSGARANILLGKDLPSAVVVDEYVAPTGAGYAIRWKDNSGEHSRGYGAEANSPHWTYDSILAVATSTK